jgi:hypothetical protein
MDEHRTSEKVSEIKDYFESAGYKVRHDPKGPDLPMVFRLDGEKVRRIVGFSMAFLDDRRVSEIRHDLIEMNLLTCVEEAQKDVSVDSLGPREVDDAYDWTGKA